MELYEDMFVPKAFSRNTSRTDLAKMNAQAAAAAHTAQAAQPNGASPSKPPLAPAPAPPAADDE